MGGGTEEVFPKKAAGGMQRRVRGGEEELGRNKDDVAVFAVCVSDGRVEAICKEKGGVADTAVQ